MKKIGQRFLLMTAVVFGSLHVSAAMNAPHPYHECLLIGAAYTGNMTKLETALAAHVNVNMQDTNTQTALMIASERGHVEIVRRILTIQGIDVDAKDSYDQTALMQASCGHDQIVAMLLAANADTDTQNLSGDIALTIAAWSGHIEIVKKLFAACADITLKNNDENTAFDIAKKRERPEIVTFLEKFIIDRSEIKKMVLEEWDNLPPEVYDAYIAPFLGPDQQK